MSRQQTVLNQSVQDLIEEGFEVEVMHNHLVVHAIPYLNQSGELKHGKLVCTYSQAERPQDHTMWFVGEHPYRANKQDMAHVINRQDNRRLFDDFMVNFYLSNKPNNQAPSNYYEKVTHYHNLFVSEARSVDPNADGRTGRVHPQRDETSVFKYPDTASSRAGITALTQKLEVPKIAIVGLGGTGSYILDLIVKTPVQEIHLFDGDDFELHNAFRSPGAVALEELQKQPKKADYFSRVYSRMRVNVEPHPCFIDESNVSELDSFNFVFLAVDNGTARKLISERLLDKGIPFIDVGMGLDLVELDNGSSLLRGACRTTLVTSQKQDHLVSHMDLSEDGEDVLYRSNIQVSDMNALNAAFAVIRWKQYMEVYFDQKQAHNMNFSISLQSLSRSATLELEEPT
ncbi:MAG: ThiF family adenylyltransferase [Thiotrichales bacterium]|nr:ThiF family adenylyltransferase [Thiotrichales bacterium]